MSISSTLIEQLPISAYNQNIQSNNGNNNNGNNNQTMQSNNGNGNGNNNQIMQSNNGNGNNNNQTMQSNNGNGNGNGNGNNKIQNYGEQLNNERAANNSQINPIDYTSQLTSVLKEATAAGATVLPSRDIPINTISLQNDRQIQPDFIPDRENDYIGDILNKEKIISEQQKKENTSDNLEYIFQMIQMPLLIGILYFIFQLPYTRQTIFSLFPSLYNKDGSQKLSGFIFNSVLFSCLYGLNLMIINNLNKQ
jgi:hypothetical protein